MARNHDTDQETYRCNDMALVTYLKQNGHSVQSVFWEADTETVYWTFMVVSSLMDLINQFASGEARVEPREYNRLFQLTKREMYSQADPHRH